jgi:hypothetical protein
MGEPVKKQAVVVDLRAARSRRVRGHLRGHAVGWEANGCLLVDYPGNPHGPLAAKTTVPLEGVLPEGAAPGRPEVLLVFEQERSDRPIVVGVIQPPKDAPGSDEPRAEAAQQPLETLLDGRRVVLDAQDEIVLRCGEASITLRRNGRVVIRGAYVETRSRGVNRIKGGSVQIN